MKYNYRKVLISILMIMAMILCFNLTAFAHSGRTDSSGGHKDNKNASGLGSYHYHCGGYPAHLHTNGICPYSSKSGKSTSSSSNSYSYSNKSSSSSTSKSSTTSSTSSSYSSTTSSAAKTNTNTTIDTKPTTITATEIKINQDTFSMEIGDIKKLTASITPDNVTDKSITWESNDESIVTVSKDGEVTAKKAGVTSIIASTSNGKTDTIAINVKEKEKIANSTIVNTTTSATTSTSNNISRSNDSEESNPMIGILTVGLLGAGGYWGYKKYKNNKQ